MKHNQKSTHVLWEGICEGLFVLYRKKLSSDWNLLSIHWAITKKDRNSSLEKFTASILFNTLLVSSFRYRIRFQLGSNLKILQSNWYSSGKSIQLWIWYPIYKFHNGPVNCQFPNSITFRSKIRSTRRHQHTYFQLRTNVLAFSYSFLRAIRIWNLIPNSVVSSDALSSFKQSALPAIWSLKVPSHLCRM